MNCPKCGSDRTRKYGHTRHGKKRRRCCDCNYQFKVESDSFLSVSQPSKSSLNQLVEAFNSLCERFESVCDRLEKLLNPELLPAASVVVNEPGLYKRELNKRQSYSGIQLEFFPLDLYSNQSQELGSNGDCTDEVREQPQELYPNQSQELGSNGDCTDEVREQPQELYPNQSQELGSSDTDADEVREQPQELSFENASSKTPVGLMMLFIGSLEKLNSCSKGIGSKGIDGNYERRLTNKQGKWLVDLIRREHFTPTKKLVLFRNVKDVSSSYSPVTFQTGYYVFTVEIESYQFRVSFDWGTVGNRNNPYYYKLTAWYADRAREQSQELEYDSLKRLNDRIRELYSNQSQELGSSCDRTDEVREQSQELHPNQPQELGSSCDRADEVREQSQELHPNQPQELGSNNGLTVKHIEKIKTRLRDKGCDFNFIRGWLEEKPIKGNLYIYYRCRHPDTRKLLSIYIGKV